MPVPVVNNASANEALPTTVGAFVIGMTATNAPTSWSITNGNFDSYYAIDATGRVTAGQTAVASATNRVLQSQNLETTPWSLTGVPTAGSPYGQTAITTAAFVAPDGTTTGELIGEGASKVIFLTATGAQTFTVPADFNSANNTISVFGAGAGGGGGSGQTVNDTGGGGGGGGFASIANLALTIGAAIPYTIGAAGVGGAAGANGTAGGPSFFNGATQAASSVAANGGSPGAAPVNGRAGGPGGTGAIGTTLFTGGTGAAGTSPVQNTDIAGGGGGAAGPNGAGGAATALTGHGGQGDNGQGGLGGAAGNPGQPGAEFTSNPGGATAGAGGGGGGGTATNGTSQQPGGLYGAGGGGGSYQNGVGGNGAQGLIVISYVPINFWRVTQAIVGTVNTTYTFSCFLRAQTRTRGYLQIDDTGGNGGYIIYDLTNGVVGIGPTVFGTGWGNFTGQIFPVGNGWFRCWISGTSSTSTAINATIGLDSGTGTGAAAQSYASGGSNVGIYAWGAQLETQTTFGAYVRTTTVTATQTSQPIGTYVLTVQATNASGSGTGTATINAVSAVVVPALSWFGEWQVPQGKLYKPNAATYDTNTQNFVDYAAVVAIPFPHSVVTGATQTSVYLLNDVQVYQLTTPLTWFRELSTPLPLAIPPYAAVRGAIDPAEAFVNFQPVSLTVPVITGGTFGETLPISANTPIVTLHATSSPTSWAIVNGNFSNYFALSNAGVLSATAAASQSVTNFILQSQTLDNASWSKTGLGGGSPFGTVTVTPNAIAAPDGTVSAELLGEGTTTNFFRITEQVSSTPTTQYTFSCFLKAQNRTLAYLQLDDNVGNGGFAIFNLSTAVVAVGATSFGTGFSAYTVSASPVGGGWSRCQFTATTNSTTLLDLTIGIDQTTAHTTYTGAGVGTGIYAWGAQLEQAASPGPYVPTLAVTASQTGQPSGNYPLSVTATNTVGTSAVTAITIQAVAPLQPPVVTNQTVNITLPLTQNETVTTMQATNSPTNWSIIGGNTGTSFAIDNTGLITVTAAGSSINTAQTFTLTVQATNSAGSGNGTCVINVQTAGQPPVVSPGTFQLPT